MFLTATKSCLRLNVHVGKPNFPEKEGNQNQFSQLRAFLCTPYYQKVYSLLYSLYISMVLKGAYFRKFYFEQ